jgi:hypothetical protein
MSGAPSGAIVGAATLGTGVVAGKTAGALMPFTGIAAGIYIALALGLLVAGFALRHVATKRG